MYTLPPGLRRSFAPITTATVKRKKRRSLTLRIQSPRSLSKTAYYSSGRRRERWLFLSFCHSSPHVLTIRTLPLPPPSLPPSGGGGIGWLGGSVLGSIALFLRSPDGFLLEKLLFLVWSSLLLTISTEFIIFAGASKEPFLENMAMVILIMC